LGHARRILNILQATTNDDDDDNIIENASCMADIHQSIHCHPQPQHDEKTTKKHQLMLTLTYLMSLVTLVGN
jgi:hypothetical protein